MQLEVCPTRCPWWIVACRILFLVTLVLLVVGSLTPAQHVPAVTAQDKVLHFAAYAVVAVLAVLSIRSPRNRMIGLAALVVLGVALELAQIFVPGRSFDLWDLAANGGGVLMGLPASRLGS
jgi:VanZ family protein